METVMSFFSSIIINIISCVAYDKGRLFIASMDKGKIEEKICAWTEKFFSTHSEMVFETSKFIDYVTYQKPLEKICEYVFNANKNVVIKEQDFVKSLVYEYKRNINDAGVNCSILEESAIRDLFYGVLVLCKEILSEKTTKGEKLILYQSQQSNVKLDAGIRDISSKIDELEEKLTHQDQITDSIVIEDVYKILSGAIWEGKLTKVFSFLSVLAGKNDDLENAVKIKLAVLSDYNVLTGEPLILCGNIKNVVLRDDVFRLLILHNFLKPDKLNPYLELISDPTLKKIAISVATGHLEDVITESKTRQNNVTSVLT